MSARRIDAGLHLLDRQVLDARGEIVGTVDDLEFTDPGDGPPRLTAILMGPKALAARVGGRLGRWIHGAATRLSGSGGPYRVPMELIRDIHVCITLSVRGEELEGWPELEHWLRDRFIARIPGARDASN